MNDHLRELHVCTQAYDKILRGGGGGGGGIPKISFFFFKFLKLFMVSDKTIHKAFRIHKTLWK